MKQDVRYRHTYVYFVHKVSLLNTTFLGSLFRRYIDRQAVKGIFLALYLHNQVFLSISVANIELILRPIKKSSLKLKKSEWYRCMSFEVKEGWGMDFDAAV